ncbi:MAG: hypothetical protein M3O77_05480, partial [Chloroflexota bacterium]|nr:hypothetical protein [Chloroflexota bacterium]
RAAQVERAAERKRVQEVGRRARAQATSERAHARRVAAARTQIARRRPAVRSAHALWLDERDLTRPPTRAELHSQLDDIAAAVVASGGGLEEIVEATDLRTRENVYRSIDPAILVRAFAHDDAAAAGAEPNRDRLRRLLPDPGLIRRRAAGEPLRTLARDYQVAHTTLARYFHRPEVARQLRNARRPVRAGNTGGRPHKHLPQAASPSRHLSQFPHFATPGAISACDPRGWSLPHCVTRCYRNGPTRPRQLLELYGSGG